MSDIPQRIGRYVLHGKLGSGGFADVWKARDAQLERWVALKVVKGTGEEEAARVTREAQTAAQLTHPNIAAIYEVGTDGGRPFIAMQLVQGTTLATLKGDARRAARLIRDAALAVQFAHERGVVHRDLKPANLMLEGDRVFVMDFGLARRPGGSASVSASGAVIGTPAYMSPEQARGETKSVDARSDVWSLGATLYELACGTPPFTGQDALEILFAVAQQEPAALRSRAAVDRDLETIVMRCLEKDPARRYASASALAEDLTRWLEGEAIHARPASVAYRAGKFLRRRRGAAAAVLIAVGAGVVAALALPAWLKERERRGGTEEDLRRERERAKAREAAAETFRRADRELAALRLRSYRRDFRLTAPDFEHMEALARECREAMARAGESGDGWWPIGRALHVLGDRRRAREAYESGLRATPEHGACSLFLARILVEEAVETLYLSRDPDRGALKEAAERGVRLVERGVAAGGIDPIELDLSRGYLKLAEGGGAAVAFCAEMRAKWAGKDFSDEFWMIEGLAEPERLRECAEQALKARASYVEALVWLGVTKLRGGEEDGGLAEFNQAVAVNPRFLPALLNRGAAFERKGAVAEARRDGEAAVAIDPSHPGGWALRGAMRAEAGERAQGLEDLGKALELHPRMASALIHRSGVLHDLGRVEEALRDLDRAVEINPRYGLAYSRKSEILRRRGDPSALAAADKAVAVEPKVAAFRAQRAAVLLSLGKYREAAAEADHAIGLDARSAEGHCHRGTARTAMGDIDGALKDLTRAIELRPRYANAYHNRAVALQHRRAFEEIIDDCTAALEIDPSLAESWYVRGAAKGNSGDHAGAAADFGRAASLAPRNAAYWMALGVARTRLGRAAEAAEDLTKAVDLDPTSFAARSHRGRARMAAASADAARARELLEGAVEDFRTALRMAPPEWRERDAILELQRSAEEQLKR